LFWGVRSFAADAIKTLLDEPVDGHFVAEEPIFRVFGFEQVECVGEKFGRLTEEAAFELPLDALFEDGIEGESQGRSIRLRLS